MVTIDLARGLRALVCLFGLLYAIPSSAQSVRLSIIDATRDVPLGGVIVTLVDDAGRSVVEGLVSGAGQRLLAAPVPGRYRVRVRRVGFKPYVSAPITLAEGEVPLVLRIPPDRITLPPVRTSARATCRSGGALDTATVIALDEVRAALASAALGWKERIEPLVTTSVERRLTLGGKRIEEQRTAKGSLYSAPFVSDSAAVMHRLGYVRFDSTDGDRTYLLPSAEVLLSDAFAAVHCFVLVEDPKDGTRVGVRFEPLVSQTRADVTGTMWLSRETSAPTSIDVQFTRVTYPARTDGASGVISLARLTSGAWYIDSWAIRMPVFTRWGAQQRTEQTGWIEQGGDAVPMRVERKRQSDQLDGSGFLRR
jgi:hypothetical protein